TFYEPLSFVHRYQRRTTSLNEQALAYASENSFTMAGRMCGVSTPSLIRLCDKRKLPQRQVLPMVIAIDEFKGDAGQERLQVSIVILRDRRVKIVEEYFRNCDTGLVQTVVMDMSRAFKHAVQRSFSSPVIIADRFHFMRQGYWALDSVRREVQHTLTRSDRLVSKRSKKLLWLAPE